MGYKYHTLGRGMLGVILISAFLSGCADVNKFSFDFREGPWVLGIQPGEQDAGYVVTEDRKSVDLPNCAVSEDVEIPILNRGGTSIALIGCWEAGKGEGGYVVISISGGSIRKIDLPSRIAAWVGEGAELLVAESDRNLYLVDVNRPNRKRLVSQLDDDVRRIDIDSTGKRALVVVGGEEYAENDKIVLRETDLFVVSLAEGVVHRIDVPSSAINAMWRPDGEAAVIETLDKWITLDVNSEQIIARNPRPSKTFRTEREGNLTQRCDLVAVLTHSSVGWCRSTGELINFTAGGEMLIEKIDQHAPLSGYVSVAADRIRDF